MQRMIERVETDTTPDVDGPLNPWSAPKGLPAGFVEHSSRPRVGDR